MFIDAETKISLTIIGLSSFFPAQDRILSRLANARSPLITNSYLPTLI